VLNITGGDGSIVLTIDHHYTLDTGEDVLSHQNCLKLDMRVVGARGSIVKDGGTEERSERIGEKGQITTQFTVTDESSPRIGIVVLRDKGTVRDRQIVDVIVVLGRIDQKTGSSSGSSVLQGHTIKSQSSNTRADRDSTVDYR
jgi:hypothetical protein